jgi:hypothetical protein
VQLPWYLSMSIHPVEITTIFKDDFVAH